MVAEETEGGGRLGICQLRRNQRDFLMRSGSPGRNGGREAVTQAACVASTPSRRCARHTQGQDVSG